MKHAAVLDIGSSKVVCMHASRAGDGRFTVGGADIRTYSGYKAGKFQDEEDLASTILESLEATQRKCGYRFRTISVAIPAPFCKLHVGTGSLTFETKPKRITDADIDILRKASLPEEAPEGYALMHSTPFSYTLDGERRSDLPLDAAPTSLEARFSHCYASEYFLNLVYEALKQVGISSICVSAMLGTALMVIPEEERERTAVLLDVGYTHTDVCLVEQSAVVDQRTIDVGGWHLANDLAYLLEIDLPVAELVKRRYVYGLDYQDSTELMRTPDGTRSVERAYVQEILEERTYELCELIYEALRDMGVEKGKSPVIHLAGGGIAMMRGSREYLEHVLGAKFTRDMPWMPRMNTPNYASVFGVMDFVLNMHNDDILTQQVEVGVLQRLRNFFVK